MTLILSRDDVQHLVQTLRGELWEALIEGMAAGFREMASGVVQQHPRIYLRYPPDGQRRPPGLFVMSGLLPGMGVMGTRLLALANNHGGDGMLLLFDHGSGRCLSIMDDAVIHNYRTGAPSGLAARYLARPDARVMGCLGSSGIARGGVTLVHHARPSVELLKVYSPTPAHRARFAAELGAELGIEARAVDSPEEAVADADLIVTATNADRPLVADAAIPAGAHLSVLARNEVELATFRRARIVTTSTQLLVNMDPPWHDPIPADWIHCELPDLVTGRASGRASADALTIFIGSAPVSLWDVVAASVFYDAARRLGRGTELDIF